MSCWRRRLPLRPSDEIPQRERAISLSRDRPLLVRFFEDLVRLPDHNIVIPESSGLCEREPALPLLFRHHSVAKAFSSYRSAFSFLSAS